MERCPNAEGIVCVVLRWDKAWKEVMSTYRGERRQVCVSSREGEIAKYNPLTVFFPFFYLRKTKGTW